MAKVPNPLPEKVVAKLLEKLGNDDVFRARFMQEPSAALREIGAPEPEACAQCLKVTKLASKEVIRATSKELTSQLTAALGLHPIRLDAR